MERALNCTVLSQSHIDTVSDRGQALRLLQDLCLVSKSANKTQISTVALGISGFLLVCGLLLLLFFFAFTLRFRTNRIVKMSSPNLSLVTLLGSTLSYTSALLFVGQEHGISMETIMQVRISLLYIGVTLVFGPLLGKSWRLHRVFTHRVPGKRVIITDMALLGLVGAILFADMLLLLTWVLTDPVRCVQTASASIRASDQETSCAVTRLNFCGSLHADLWIGVLVGFKALLLIYGSYLAGLTNHISSPPVNQSLAILVGACLVMVSTGAVFLVTRFFHTWPSLVYGMTSGSILICTTTINCLIFIPQLLQWRQFEEEQSPNVTQMAKYFNSPSKSLRTMYSEDDIYHLLGENASMRRLLTEKNAVIESLQEQVNNAKDKLVKLLSTECRTENLETPIWDGQKHETTGSEQNNEPTNGHHEQSISYNNTGTQHGTVVHQQEMADSGSDVSGLKQALHRIESYDHVPDESQVIQKPTECSSSKQSHKMPFDSRSVSFTENLTKAQQKLGGALETLDVSRRVNYVSSEKLQEILKELSMETLQGCGHLSPKKQIGASHCAQQETVSLSSEGFRKVCLSLSPYMMRRRRGSGYVQRRHHSSSQFSSAVGPPTWCIVNKGGRTLQNGVKKMIDERLIKTAERKVDEAGFEVKHNLASSLPNNIVLSVQMQDDEEKSRENYGLWVKNIYPTDTQENPAASIPYNHTALDTYGIMTMSDLRSQTPYTETDSSSSDEAICCCHRPYCELCYQNTCYSSDSYTSETESCSQQQGLAQLNMHSQAVVNFNEDLKPTFV